MIGYANSMFFYNPAFFGTVDSYSNTKSLSFDGVDEYVDIGRVTELESTATFSISFWIKPASIGTQQRIIGRYTASDYIFIAIQATGKLVFGVRNGGGSSQTDTTTILSTNTWYKVDCVFDGGLSAGLRVQVYLDGTLETPVLFGTAPTTTGSNTTSFNYGRWGGLGGNNYNGQIDELAFFDYALTSGEVTSIYNSGCPNNLMELADPKKPEHYYRNGDNDTYPTITDIGQTAGNNGTMANAESIDLVTNTPCGFNNFSLSSDGVDEWVDYGLISKLSNVSNCSISGWVEITSLSTSYYWSSFEDTSNMLTLLYNSSVGEMWIQHKNTGNDSTYKLATGFSTSGWHHFTVVFDGSLADSSKVKLYLDGVLQTLTYVGSPKATTATITTKGFSTHARYDAASFLTGSIDEVAVFDYSLTSGEATSIYNSGVPNDLMELASAKQPEHYYRMGDNDTYPTITDIGVTGTNNGTMINQEILDINGNVPLENN